jgi:hypothetical protein
MQTQKRSALDAALSVASLINGPILGCFMLAAMKRGGPASAFAGMTAGVAVVMTVWLATPIAWPWYTVIGSLTTVIAGSAAWALTRRTGAELPGA